MKRKKREIDPLPERFESIDEAGEFWDTHDLTDYEEFLEPVEFEVDIKRRHFEIEVDEDCFIALRSAARRKDKPTRQVASEILKRSLGV